MKREEVYKIIDEEREYQNSLWYALDQSNNIGDFMIYMENYLQRAKQANNPDEPEETLHNLRKVIAIGIGCFEKFGVPSR